MNCYKPIFVTICVISAIVNLVAAGIVASPETIMNMIVGVMSIIVMFCVIVMDSKIK